MISLILVLAFLGIVLLIAEIIVPGGVVGVLGLICLTISVVLSLTSSEVADAGGWVPPTLVGGIVLATLAAVFGFMRLMRAGFMARHMSLKSSIQRPEQERRSLIGSHGTALTDLRPQGRVEVGGRQMPGRSERGVIQAGTAVEVVALEFGEPVVRKQSAETAATAPARDDAPSATTGAAAGS